MLYLKNNIIEEYFETIGMYELNNIDEFFENIQQKYGRDVANDLGNVT